MGMRWSAVSLLLLVAGCGGDPGQPAGLPDDGAVFVLEVSGEEFRTRVTDAAAFRRLEERMAAGAEGVVSGELVPGDGGINGPWSWHWEPASVHVPDVAVEVCDGRPSMVEDDLEYWLDTVGRFCPWGARVVRRER